MGYRVLERICDGSQYEKNKLGNDGFLISMDAKIEQMSKCDVDRRLYVLRLLVCLTRNSDSNLLQARDPRTSTGGSGWFSNSPYIPAKDFENETLAHFYLRDY